MQKSCFAATLFFVVIGLAISVSAGSIGSVKADFDPNVGHAIVNTTASGKLNVTIHLDDALPNEEFIINLRLRYQDGTIVPFEQIGTLTTNDQGNGNAQVQVDIDPPANSNRLRRLAVRVRRPGPPSILYVATIYNIPLKKGTPDFTNQ